MRSPFSRKLSSEIFSHCPAFFQLLCVLQPWKQTDQNRLYKIFLIIKILLAIAFRTPDEKDSLQLRRFVIFLRPSQSWVNILRQLRLTLDITIVGNLPASKSNFAFDILSILIGNGQP